MNADRMLVARAVFAGQLPASVLTDSEITEIQLNAMELIINSKLSQGLIVFADHDTVQ